MRSTTTLMSALLATTVSAGPQLTIWDIILNRDSSQISSNLVQTNPFGKSIARTATTTTTTTTTTTKPPTVSTEAPQQYQVMTGESGKRRIIVSLEDLYHCMRPGAQPIDGDCSRFLMCRREANGPTFGSGRLKGRVYRCPKGYLFSNSSARCRKESEVRCHRSSRNKASILP